MCCRTYCLSSTLRFSKWAGICTVVFFLLETSRNFSMANSITPSSHWGVFAGWYTRDTWDWLVFMCVSTNDLFRTDWLEVCWEYKLALGSLVSFSPLTGYLRIWCNEGGKEGCFWMNRERFYFDGRTKWDFSLILRVIHWRNLFVGTSY